MIASEELHAAAYVSDDGHGHIFDDIGDMVQLHLQEPDEVVAFFVHDYQDGAWIRAETAHYVRSDGVTTPMFSGLAAFAHWAALTISAIPPLRYQALAR